MHSNYPYHRPDCTFNYCDWDEREQPNPCRTMNKCRHANHTIINGKSIADSINIQTKQRITQLDLRPTLTVILIGGDQASKVYIRNKQLACQTVGICSNAIMLPTTTSETELLAIITRLNTDHTINGILVQLPLPSHIDTHTVLAHIDPLKDVDGFHPTNIGLLAAGSPRFVPCTPLGIATLLDYSYISTSGAHVVIIGRSQIVGKPMALWLLQKGKDATVTICHSKTTNLDTLTKQADILIVATGQAKLITAAYIKPGAVVIDVGIHKLDDGTLCGDVDFDSASKVASHITPVPGGVGPMTIAMLLRNTLQAALQE